MWNPLSYLFGCNNYVICWGTQIEYEVTTEGVNPAHIYSISAQN
jgi:hypothetical protein